jgi:pyruvate/2-oxoglutarate dehydrogenase complex dihydrolipoamide acyltransferase (E2) component
MSDYELRVPTDIQGPFWVTWRIQSGQQVRAGQTICELETDRASVELQAPHECVIETVVGSGIELRPGDLYGRVRPV